MKWNNKCQYTPASLREKSYEELYTRGLSAYTEGRTDERNKSLEAYRLRCSCLFGNKCMDSSLSVGVRKRICDGNCHYIKKYICLNWTNWRNKIHFLRSFLIYISTDNFTLLT